jgi:hypothetical protein
MLPVKTGTYGVFIDHVKERVFYPCKYIPVCRNINIIIYTSATEDLLACHILGIEFDSQFPNVGYFTSISELFRGLAIVHGELVDTYIGEKTP